MTAIRALHTSSTSAGHLRPIPLHQHQPVWLNPCVAVSVPPCRALVADTEETSRGFNQKELHNGIRQIDH